MYTGREWLPEIGLYDYRNRVYSAELGRFLQNDPIGFDAADLNLYRYVRNDYSNYVDPYGELPPPEWLWHSGCYYLGRPGTPVPPGGIISRFLVKYIPGMYPFAKLHDRFVGYMEQQKYIPDIAYNIPSMAPTFVVAVFAEAVKTVSFIVSWIIQKWGGE